jgi:hypothetical protein
VNLGARNSDARGPYSIRIRQSAAVESSPEQCSEETEHRDGYQNCSQIESPSRKGPVLRMRTNSSIDNSTELITCHTTWYLACRSHSGLVAWVRPRSITNVPSPWRPQRRVRRPRGDRRMRHGFSSPIYRILQWAFANAPFLTLRSPGDRWQTSIDAVDDRGGQACTLS